MASYTLSEMAHIALERIELRIQPLFHSPTEHQHFVKRLRAHFVDFFTYFNMLYGQEFDFYYHLEATVLVAAQSYIARPSALKALDEHREANPRWFESEQMLGAVCYVDLFAGDLKGLRNKISYFQELGLTYLHLMPLFKCPEPRNDGGYAVSSFREVNPKLGTMEELKELADALGERGISLVVDFVFNHTSDEHEWAKLALSGSARYQRYYRMFPDRTLPDQYEPHLREIFPEQAPGSFTWRADISKWVWTTFYPFQWDLNYANPEVFTAMFGEMLFLANQGVEVLRLDAVPFIWKELGTNCENLPQTHWIIRGLNALMRIAAPSLLFKSEAIVHPRDVRSYISPDECQLSYNPIMMVSLWEAAATRNVRFMTHTMQKQFALSPGTAWINYLRSHDDIGWGFADEDAGEIGINGFDHRYFLNQFYTGRFEGSFARGVPFNYNPRTQDMRISGTMASLGGLEEAEEKRDERLTENAVRRLLLMFGVTLAAGGIPLIYLGDEVGTLNDYDYVKQPGKAEDSRWIHRPYADQARYNARLDVKTPSGQLYRGLHKLLALRKSLHYLAAGETQFVYSGNDHVLAIVRHHAVLVLANMSDYEQIVSLSETERYWHAPEYIDNLITGERLWSKGQVTLPPYHQAWLVAVRA